MKKKVTSQVPERDNSLPTVLSKRLNLTSKNKMVKNFLAKATGHERDEVLLALEVMTNLAIAAKNGQLEFCFVSLFKKLNQDEILLTIVHEVSYALRLNRQRYTYALNAHKNHTCSKKIAEPRWLTRKEVTEKYLGQHPDTRKWVTEEDLVR
ncbi:MAG: hypothetical protein WCF94_01545 [bacterium]